MSEDREARIAAARERAFAPPKPTLIPVGEMEERGIYRIIARNFFVGVWNGKDGLIGIREKFGHRYLFTEYHYDVSPSVGTARPMEKIGTLPDGIAIDEDWENRRLFEALHPYVEAENERWARENPNG